MDSIQARERLHNVHAVRGLAHIRHFATTPFFLNAITSNGVVWTQRLGHILQRIVCLWLMINISMSASTAMADDGRLMIQKGGKMKLEELIHKLSDAYPWTVHEVEGILGIKLSNYRPHADNSFLSTRQLAYEEGLLLKEVEVRITERAGRTGETVRLILDLADEAACFTFERIKQSYPDLALTSIPRTQSLEDQAYFSSKQPWGRLSLGFKEKRPNCLSSIIFIPKWDD
ncbi:MAG: hypothetical protein LBE06_00125 [Azoarcus sp.]|jgi:hypothetical protein|nr:hypothetical protein [Azoarcus sp.]